MRKNITHTFTVDVEKWVYSEPLSGPDLRQEEYVFSGLDIHIHPAGRHIKLSSIGFFLESLGFDYDSMYELQYNSDEETFTNAGMPKSLASLFAKTDLENILPIANVNIHSMSSLAHFDMTGRRNLMEAWWEIHGIAINFSDETRAEPASKEDIIVPNSLQEVLASSDNLLIASVRSFKRAGWAGVYLFAINDMIGDGNPPVYTRISDFEIGGFPFRVPTSIHRVIDSLATLLTIDGFEVSYIGYVMNREEHQVHDIKSFDLDEENRDRFGIVDKDSMHTFLYEKAITHFEGLVNV